jgi:hypothetical protein
VNKLISLILLSLSFSVYADYKELDQSADLTDYNISKDHYFNWVAGDAGSYTLIRDKNSPDKVLVKISKKFTDQSFTKTQHVVDTSTPLRPKYLGSLKSTHPVSDEMIVELDFTDANKLTDEEVEEIILNLDFSSGDIDIRKVGMNSADSGRAYEIDKDTWGINDAADVRYEFSSTTKE